MKRFLINLIFILISFSGGAQILEPVKWKFSARKLSVNIYEVHITAVIQDGWAIYSQISPKEGPFPTKITFLKNANVLLGGKIKEAGEMIKKYEQLFFSEVYSFKEQVDFVQIIKKKHDKKTLLSGKVAFMACNSTKCLNPTDIPFTIILD